METEGKGFVVRDRRAFDDQGDPREEETQDTRSKEPEAAKPEEEGAGWEQAAEQAAKQAGEKAGEKAEGRESAPLPEVNFSTLIMSLSSSALFHLGEIPDPQTGQKTRDLPLAKHTIDTIGMLQEKTQGNLNDEEQKFIDSMLADLRWRYVKASG